MRQDLIEIAKRLAEDDAGVEPEMVEILLFPAEDEIRLIEVDRTAMPSRDEIAPWYFGRDTKHGIPVPLAVALITPEDRERLAPPSEWGKWDDALVVWRKKAA